MASWIAARRARPHRPDCGAAGRVSAKVFQVRRQLCACRASSIAVSSLVLRAHFVSANGVGAALVVQQEQNIRRALNRSASGFCLRGRRRNGERQPKEFTASHPASLPLGHRSSKLIILRPRGWAIASVESNVMQLATGHPSRAISNHLPSQPLFSIRVPRVYLAHKPLQISRDGSRIIFTQAVEQSAPPVINVAAGWRTGVPR